ncbi:DUF5993 family protein [Reyranella sp.]|uniref:DUF5993 family protein n=1 Tax=Reyranella sp. TaxID=1929291 RepID=UPI003BAC5899
MTAAIFLVTAIAMMAAVAGLRGIAVGLFMVSLVTAGFWLDHHMVDRLLLSF